MKTLSIYVLVIGLMLGCAAKKGGSAIIGPVETKCFPVLLSTECTCIFDGGKKYVLEAVTNFVNPVLTLREVEECPCK